MATTITLTLEVHLKDPVPDPDEAAEALRSMLLSALTHGRLDPQAALPAGTHIHGYAVSTAVRRTTPHRPKEP